MRAARLVCSFLFAVSATQAAEAQKSRSIIAPTAADVPYGTHESQRLDFWKAESPKRTPLLFFVHGGGWMNGDKSNFNDTQRYLKAGISVVSINYRFVPQAVAAGIKPPVQAPMHDAARALQFVRSKSVEWNIDKTRIGASGSSAGACTSLWLAFHDDLADPESSDPIARESTRLWCVAVAKAQTSLDPQQMKEWTPNSRYGGHAFGFAQFGEFLKERATVLEWITEYSPYALVTADDPAIYLYYLTPPALGQEEEDTAHTANFGVKLQERLKDAGVPCELVYPGAPEIRHPQMVDYLIDTLKAPAAK